MNFDIEKLLKDVPRSSFIANEFIGGAQNLEIENPNTKEILLTASATNDPEVFKRALSAASDASASWAETSPRERSEYLRTLFELCLEHTDELAHLMTLEMGKPLQQSRGEVSYGAEFLRWFSEEAVRFPGRHRRASANAKEIVEVEFRPVGPSLLITPWNFPLSMATRKIAPALAAGCTVVLKPASQTPLTALYFMQLVKAAGIPSGVVNCVLTSDSQAFSETLLLDERLRKLSFTGSTAVGVKLLESAAKQVLRSSMELGGNAPFLVLESADIDTAVNALMTAKFRNNGQACTAANRIIVDKKIAPAFTTALSERIKKMKVLPGLADGDLSALINGKALKEMQELVDDALAKGAKLLVGGKVPDLAPYGEGYFYPPTLLTEVPTEARVFKEEIFGPIAPLFLVDGVEEAIKLANATEYGLVAYVIGEDPRELKKAVRGLESGMIGVNTGLVSDPTAPFGGVKQSGIGREGSHEGLNEYLEPIYVRYAE